MAKFLVPPFRTIFNAISSRATAHHVKRSSWHIARSNSTITQYGGRRRQLSVEITNESHYPDTKFFEILETLRPSTVWDGGRMGRLPKTPGIHHSLVILFTPGFIPWFNDDDFIPKILKRISRESELKSEELQVFQVLYACVDGIAPKIHNGSFQGQRVTQGFSFLWAPYTLKGNLFNSQAVPDEPTTGSSPAILFNNNYRKRHVSVPLAKTIFQTGKRSMLVYSVWALEGGEFVLSKKRADKSHAYVQAFRGISDDTALYSFIPARPVTPFRTIETGMGNIVRSINFGEGDVGPASRELETAVSEISTSLGGSKVDVWALIKPPSVVNAETDDMPETGPGYVGAWLKKGAKLCRVVSGGGGWGPKQGLLSLDPDTQWIKPTTASATEYGTIAEQEGSSMGNLAEASASIQFLVLDNDLESPGPRWRTSPEKPRSSIVFGSIPDTIDNIPEVKDRYLTTSYSYTIGHFGCVSGSGIYVGPTRYGVDLVVKEKTSIVADTKEVPESQEERPPFNVLESTIPKGIEEETLEASEVLESTTPKNIGEETPKASDVLESRLPEIGEESELQEGPKITKVWVEAKGVEKTKIDLPYSYVYLDYDTMAREKEERLTKLFKKPQKPQKPLPFQIRKINFRYANEAYLAKKASKQAPE